MNKISFLLIFSLLFSSILGCSARGRSIPKNEICAANYDPLPITDNKKYGNKLEIKPGVPFAPAPSDYAYQGAELFYYNIDLDIKIHLAESISASGGSTRSIVCVSGSGITRDMSPVTFSIPIVSDLLIVDGLSSKIRTRIFSFDLRSRPNSSLAPLQYMVTTEDHDFVDGSPQNSYPDYTEVEQVFATVAGPQALFQLVANLKNVSHDQKSGKELSLVVKTLVSMKPVSSDERKKIDDPETTALSSFSF